MKELIVGSEMILKNANDKKKTLIHRIFSKRDSHCHGDGSMNKHPIDSYGTEGQTNRVRKSSFSCCAESPTMPNAVSLNPFRVFAATWNVGGITPHGDLNLDDFLQVHDESDIYVLGFQEIVPLNAGNVLVIEDNAPAARWLALINQSLNRSSNVNILQSPSTSYSELHSIRSSKSTVTVVASNSGSIFYKKSSLRKISKKYRTEEKRKLKMCNCATELEKKNSRDSCFGCQDVPISEDEFSSEEEDGPSSLVSEISALSSKENQMKYSLVVSKQMVGIFVTIWMKRELVQHVGHLRTSCISRGIMGCLGNKGCISVSLSFHQTSFCFVCSHLASGEREGDELRRNSDVIEILRSTQFPKRCRMPNSRMPDKILDHDRVIWFGDLNYRISLSYNDTRKLLEQNNWDALLAKDQLKMEREAGRVFKGWKEGKIYFPPTYKYSYNSDVYSGETISSKNKRRTPAWCDRILWHGNGIHQLSYIRGENRFSDHRPVWAKFLVDVWVAVGGSPKKGLLSTNMKVGAEELLPISIIPLSISNRCL